MTHDQRASELTIADRIVQPGSEISFDLRVARVPSGTWMSLPVTVMHGALDGPKIWLSAGVHGDELNGIEVIRRVRAAVSPDTLRGTIVAVPVVNVFGFINQSRYLPDRRDLNRSFPGSQRGSLASRLASLFMKTIVEPCELGIDLHTGSDRRDNLPQVRGDLRDPETRRLAIAFGAPIMMHSRLRDGSLREAATRRGARVLLYEGGEAHRFSDDAIEVGTAGVMRTLAAMRMVTEVPAAPSPSLESYRSGWVRARRGGIVRLEVELGQHVSRGEPLATIADPLGDAPVRLRAAFDGYIIALSRSPVASQGDAVIHIARVDETTSGPQSNTDHETDGSQP